MSHAPKRSHDNFRKDDVRFFFEMLAAYKGRIYDPCCGPDGISRNSESRSEAEPASRKLPAGRAQLGKFIEAHGDKPDQIAIYGQDKWARRQRR